MHCTERVGQGEVGGVTCRVLHTWQLLGLAVRGPWLTQGGLIFALAAITGLENITLTLSGKNAWAPSGCLPTENADYCVLINNDWA